MTSTTGTGEHPTGEHPEVSEISDLTDGLLSPSRSVDVRQHLAGCPLCDDVYASLEEIRALLGTLPGPVRMPADVAGRIDAALAAEALLDATAPGGAGAHVSRETATLPVAVSRETDELPRRATPPARPSGRPRGSSGPGRQSPGGRSSRSRRWPRILLSSAAAAAVFSFGGLLIQNAAVDGTQAKSPGRTTATPKETTDRALTAASLGSHVHDLLASKGSHKSPEIGTRTSPESTMRGGADTIPSCVRLGIKRTETPLASSHTQYQGKDAYLVVLPNPSDPKRVSAYVVSSSCVSATPPAPGKVLLSHSYQRD